LFLQLAVLRHTHRAELSCILHANGTRVANSQTTEETTQAIEAFVVKFADRIVEITKLAQLCHEQLRCQRRRLRLSVSPCVDTVKNRPPIEFGGFVAI
jgi:hypothetical protein